MNKKKKVLIIISSILMLLLVLIVGYIIINKDKAKEPIQQDKEKEVSYEIEKTTNMFSDQSGNQIEIKADKLVTATGFAGANNHQYYLRGTTLYYRNTSDINLDEQILAYNINDIYIEKDYVVAEQLGGSKIITDNKYIKYKDIVNTNNYKEKTQEGEEIIIYADKLETATGFAGASNHQYYLRGTTLYYRNTANTNNKEEILAYNVKDIYIENDNVVAELLDNGNVITYNEYITYKNQKTAEYNYYYFTDQSNNQIIIEANKLVTATGFAGASNHQYYLREKTLYYRNTSDINLDEQILAYNIKDILLEKDQVIAIQDGGSSIITENKYIKYRD